MSTLNKTKPPYLEVVHLLVEALLLRRLPQGAAPHRRRGDLRTGGQDLNGLPQEVPLAAQLDPQRQGQQLLTLALLPLGPVGHQLPSETPRSALLRLGARAFGIPEALHLLRGELLVVVGAVQLQLASPATGQGGGGGGGGDGGYAPIPSDPGGRLMTASAELTLHLV